MRSVAMIIPYAVCFANGYGTDQGVVSSSQASVQRFKVVAWINSECVGSGPGLAGSDHHW